MSGFSNPLVGGGGNLVYPSIQSPNFSIAGETGWAILKNGNAYFYDVTATGIIVNTVVVSGSGEGIFTYSGAPALGNLISTTGISVGGTDGEGNAYLAGTTSYVNGGGGTYFAINLEGGTATFYASTAGAGGPYAEFAGIGFSFAGAAGHMTFSATDGTFPLGSLELTGSGGANLTGGVAVDFLSVGGQALTIPNVNASYNDQGAAPAAYSQSYTQATVTRVNALINGLISTGVLEA